VLHPTGKVVVLAGIQGSVGKPTIPEALQIVGMEFSVLLPVEVGGSQVLDRCHGLAAHFVS
jgi:hypothetical protein